MRVEVRESGSPRTIQADGHAALSRVGGCGSGSMTFLDGFSRLPGHRMVGVPGRALERSFRRLARQTATVNYAGDCKGRARRAFARQTPEKNMAHRTRSFVRSYPVLATALVAALAFAPACKQDTSQVPTPSRAQADLPFGNRAHSFTRIDDVLPLEVDTAPQATPAIQEALHAKAGEPSMVKESKRLARTTEIAGAPPPSAQGTESNTERYAHVTEQPFTLAEHSPLSTFSVDVDTASYSNVRRLLRAAQSVDPGAVRVEEMINYFTYDYPAPDAGQPFSITTEVNQAPWAPEHRLLLVGLQGKEVAAAALPPRNLVFLIDVSGSMEEQHKLPLLKQSFGKLLDTLGERDRVAIVVYAGASGLVLPPTPATDRMAIEAALEHLSAGGSTNGAAGIELAYEVARRHAVEGGINRVILATDGDFNIGTTSESALTTLIEKKREEGVSLTTLGFGMGNYNDSTLERLADNGNGNYAYIDTLEEAEKVLVREVSGTLFTIAKDVKIQVEFNPALVGAYRLIGYDNRRLTERDFNEDRKDAGDIGAGHRVTALYELLTPAQSKTLTGVDALEYQHVTPKGDTEELLTVKLRYKDPEGEQSRLLKVPVANVTVAAERASENLRFASAAAAFGMYLRRSEFSGHASPRLALELARGALGEDHHGYRQEFVQLVSTLAGEQPQAIAR